MRTQRLNLQGRSPLQSGEFPGESRTIDPVRSPLRAWISYLPEMRRRSLLILIRAVASFMGTRPLCRYGEAS